MTFKDKVYDLINEEDKSSRASNIFNWFIVILITLNVVAIIAESFVGMRAVFGRGFWYFEIFSVGVFTIEYIARLWTFDLKYPNKKTWSAFKSALISPLAILDLLAILPTYLPFIIPFDLRFLRILRPMRIIQVFKLSRYFKALKLIGNVFKEKRWELEVTFFMALILLLLSSTLMYYAESTAQPEVFPNIIASLWWSIVTLTTVGYGDVVPITSFGKLIGGLISILGIGLVALPTAILGSAFIEKRRESVWYKEHKCRACRRKSIK